MLDDFYLYSIACFMLNIYYNIFPNSNHNLFVKSSHEDHVLSHMAM